MRLRFGPLLRRARRVGLISIRSCRRQFWSDVPVKHIKIDDEERQSDEAFPPRSSHLRLVKMILFMLLALLLLLFVVAYTIYKPPRFVISFFQWKYPDVLFHVPLPSNQKIVALTLDDAPSAETARILDALKVYGAKATFFIIGGQAAAHPDLLQRMHDEGHELGNHASADEPSVKLPLAELERQITEVGAMLPPSLSALKYFRPGSGFFSKQMVERVKGLGYRVVLGSIYPHDPQIHSAKINAAHVLSMVRPGGIIIMHDRRSYSVEQVETVLKGLATGGWKVESLGGLLRAAENVRGKKNG